jgi:hypothetical protein
MRDLFELAWKYAKFLEIASFAVFPTLEFASFVQYAIALVFPQ